MPIIESTTTPNVWVIEGDDHEIRVVEAKSPDEALELAAKRFAEQYDEPYSSDLCRVVGAFTGDIDEPDELVFVTTSEASDEVDAREALDRW